MCPVPVEGNGDPECVEMNGKDPVGTKGEHEPEPVYTGVSRWVGQETSLVDRFDRFFSFRPRVRLFPRIGTRTTTNIRARSREEE